jgi:hypothetical protein
MIDARKPSRTPIKNLRKQLPPQGTEPHHLVHEMLNQLTVMNLSCFRFRAAAEKCCPPSLLIEIQRMERAVTEMTALLERVAQVANPKAGGRIFEVVEGSEDKIAEASANNVIPSPSRVHSSFSLLK